MIKNFLIINFTGKNNLIGLKVNDKFLVKKFQDDIKSSNSLVVNISKFFSINKVKMNNKFSILVNLGPGSFSAIRIAISVAKGIKIVYGSALYGYKDNLVTVFSLENIQKLIKNKQLEDKMIKPIYKNLKVID